MEETILFFVDFFSHMSFFGEYLALFSFGAGILGIIQNHGSFGVLCRLDDPWDRLCLWGRLFITIGEVVGDEFHLFSDAPVREERILHSLQ